VGIHREGVESAMKCTCAVSFLQECEDGQCTGCLCKCFCTNLNKLMAIG
jgi:hypothetical protein